MLVLIALLALTPYGVGMCQQYGMTGPYIKGTYSLGFENPGVRVVKVDPHPGYTDQPTYLYICHGLRTYPLMGLKDLNGLVTIKTAGDALKFVRVRTDISPDEIRSLGYEPACEVVRLSDRDKRASEPFFRVFTDFFLQRLIRLESLRQLPFNPRVRDI